MIFQTSILALLLISALSSVTALWASGFALKVLRHWNIASGSATQLQIERKTELVSTLFRVVLLAEIAALLLLVFNADRMAALFVGAMCAVGTFNVNDFGFPALYLKIAVFFAATLWLVVDRLDRQGHDFPLTRLKYKALLVIAPLILISAGTELAFFLNLKTDVITSCCSKLFTPTNKGIAAEMTGIPPAQAFWLLTASGAAVALTGAYVLLCGNGVRLFALAGLLFFFTAIAAIISVISLYVYEHPNHHCPFCILKPEYGYVGYALYLPLFIGTTSALGTGLIQLLEGHESLANLRPILARNQTKIALIAFSLFGLVVAGIITRSQLMLFGWA